MSMRIDEEAEHTAVTPERVMQLGLGFWGSKTVLSAVELGLFTELGVGPLNAEELRRRLGLHARSAHDFLDALVSLGLLERDGEVFVDPLPQADVITMGHILHDWPLETKKELLAKAHAALPDGGAMLVFDAVIDNERRSNTFGLLMSLNMLIETTGGFDYTGADCQQWMREVGFGATYVEHLAGPDSMVVGIK